MNKDIVYIAKNLLLKSCRESEVLNEKSKRILCNYIKEEATYEQLLNLAFNPIREDAYMPAEILEESVIDGIMKPIDTFLSEGYYDSAGEWVKDKVGKATQMAGQRTIDQSKAVNKLTGQNTAKNPSADDIEKTYKGYEKHSAVHKGKDAPSLGTDVKNYPKQIPKDVKNSPYKDEFKNVATAAAGAAAGAGLYYLYNKYFKQNAKKCADLTGAAKQNCMKAAKDNAKKKAKAVSQKAESVMEAAKNPSADDIEKTYKGYEKYSAVHKGKDAPSFSEDLKSYMEKGLEDLKDWGKRMNEPDSGYKNLLLALGGVVGILAVLNWAYKKYLNKEAAECRSKKGAERRKCLRAASTRAKKAAKKEALKKAREKKDKK